MKRKTVSLSSSLECGLKMYALAASAAGVGVLALAPPAEARIVFTHAHHFIGKNGSYDLDLNHDGIAEFVIRNYYHISGNNVLAYARASRAQVPGGGSSGPTSVQVSYISPTTGGGYPGFALALKKGSAVPEKCACVYVQQALLARVTSNRRRGNWLNVTNRYLSLRFQIHGKFHYGWARLTVKLWHDRSFTSELTGYAYETIPNKPIKAGQTHSEDQATLGRLAQGASGVRQKQ